MSMATLVRMGVDLHADTSTEVAEQVVHLLYTHESQARASAHAFECEWKGVLEERQACLRVIRRKVDDERQPVEQKIGVRQGQRAAVEETRCAILWRR